MAANSAWATLSSTRSQPWSLSRYQPGSRSGSAMVPGQREDVAQGVMSPVAVHGPELPAAGAVLAQAVERQRDVRHPLTALVLYLVDRHVHGQGTGGPSMRTSATIEPSAAGQSATTAPSMVVPGGMRTSSRSSAVSGGRRRLPPGLMTPFPISVLTTDFMSPLFW